MATTYEQWVATQDVPVYKGYHIEDLKTLNFGFWKKRGCPTAFLQLAGQEGVGETRLTEIPPGETLPQWNFALDEVVYVADGRGLTTVWDTQKKNHKIFE